MVPPLQMELPVTPSTPDRGRRGAVDGGREEDRRLTWFRSILHFWVPSLSRTAAVEAFPADDISDLSETCSQSVELLSISGGERGREGRELRCSPHSARPWSAAKNSRARRTLPTTVADEIGPIKGPLRTVQHKSYFDRLAERGETTSRFVLERCRTFQGNISPRNFSSSGKRPALVQASKSEHLSFKFNSETSRVVVGLAAGLAGAAPASTINQHVPAAGEADDVRAAGVVAVRTRCWNSGLNNVSRGGRKNLRAGLSQEPSKRGRRINTRCTLDKGGSGATLSVKDRRRAFATALGTAGGEVTCHSAPVTLLTRSTVAPSSLPLNRPTDPVASRSKVAHSREEQVASCDSQRLDYTGAGCGSESGVVPSAVLYYPSAAAGVVLSRTDPESQSAVQVRGAGTSRNLPLPPSAVAAYPESAVPTIQPSAFFVSSSFLPPAAAQPCRSGSHPDSEIPELLPRRCRVRGEKRTHCFVSTALQLQIADRPKAVSTRADRYIHGREDDGVCSREVQSNRVESLRVSLPPSIHHGPRESLIKGAPDDGTDLPPRETKRSRCVEETESDRSHFALADRECFLSRVDKDFARVVDLGRAGRLEPPLSVFKAVNSDPSVVTHPAEPCEVRRVQTDRPSTHPVVTRAPSFHVREETFGLRSEEDEIQFKTEVGEVTSSCLSPSCEPSVVSRASLSSSLPSLTSSAPITASSPLTSLHGQETEGVERSASMIPMEVSETVSVVTLPRFHEKSYESELRVKDMHRHKSVVTFEPVLAPVRHADTLIVFGHNSTRRRYVSRTFYEPRVKPRKFAETDFLWGRDTTQRYASFVDYHIDECRKWFKTCMELKAKTFTTVHTFPDASSSSSSAVTSQSCRGGDDVMVNGVPCDDDAFRRDTPGASQVFIPRQKTEAERLEEKQIRVNLNNNDYRGGVHADEFLANGF